MCQLWCVLEIIVNKLATIAKSTTAHPNEMSANAYFMPRAMSTCVLQANVLIRAYFMPRAMSTCVVQVNVLIRGVVVLDVRWVVPNC